MATGTFRYITIKFGTQINGIIPNHAKWILLLLRQKEIHISGMIRYLNQICYTDKWHHSKPCRMHINISDEIQHCCGSHRQAGLTLRIVINQAIKSTAHKCFNNIWPKQRHEKWDNAKKDQPLLLMWSTKSWNSAGTSACFHRSLSRIRLQHRIIDSQ